MQPPSVEIHTTVPVGLGGPQLGQATTTTTTTAAHSTTTSTGFIQSRVHTAYFKTLPGILKIAQVGLGIIALLCVAFGGHGDWSGVEFFEFVGSTSIIITLVLIFLYLCKVVVLIQRIPWFLIEFAYCAATAALYLIASSILASVATGRAAFGAGAFFGYCAMVVFGIDAFFKFKGWRGGQRPLEELIMESSATNYTPATGPV